MYSKSFYSYNSFTPRVTTIQQQQSIFSEKTCHIQNTIYNENCIEISFYTGIYIKLVWFYLRITFSIYACIVSIQQCVICSQFKWDLRPVVGNGFRLLCSLHWRLNWIGFHQLRMGLINCTMKCVIISRRIYLCLW